MQIGLVSEDGNVSKNIFRTKEINNFSDYIQELYNSIESTTMNSNSICIGIGAPNASKNGTMKPHNLKWEGKLNLVEELKNKVNTVFYLMTQTVPLLVNDVWKRKRLCDFI